MEQMEQTNSAEQPMASARAAGQALLLELDEDTWKGFLDSYESWLGNTLMLQTTFRRMVEDTASKIAEPHIREYLAELGKAAQAHEQRAEELFRLIGRDPATGRKAGGLVMSKLEEVLATVQGLAGGATGNWRDIRQLLIANLDALGAFAVAEQLALALGLPEIVDVTFNVIHEKQTAHLLIQEYMLEMASQSILYHSSI